MHICEELKTFFNFYFFARIANRYKKSYNFDLHKSRGLDFEIKKYRYIPQKKENRLFAKQPNGKAKQKHSPYFREYFFSSRRGGCNYSSSVLYRTQIAKAAKRVGSIIRCTGLCLRKIRQPFKVIMPSMLCCFELLPILISGDSQ